MRSVTILSGIAILTLAAAGARAQTTTGAATADPAAASTAGREVSGDKAAASSQKHEATPARSDSAGYNAKTTKTPAQSEGPPPRNKWPGYGQFSGDPDAAMPYGPPR